MEISNEQVCSKIIRFIRKEVKKRSAQVVVVGISGGIDSAVAVALAAQALGPDKVFGLLLPDSSVTPKKDTSHALELVRGLKIRYKTIELKTLRKHLLQRLPNNKLAGGSTICRRSTKPLLYRGLSTNEDGSLDIYILLVKEEMKHFVEYQRTYSRVYHLFVRPKQKASPRFVPTMTS